MPSRDPINSNRGPRQPRDAGPRRWGRPLVALAAVLAALGSSPGASEAQVGVTPAAPTNPQVPAAPGTALAPAAPGPAAVAPVAARPLTVGIGSIVFEQDSSVASFDFARYLKSAPIVTSCGTAVVQLVDFPTEADISVTGRIGGGISYKKESSGSGGLVAGGLVLAQLGGLSFLAGGVFGFMKATGTSNSLPSSPLLISGALAVAGGFAMALLPGALHRGHHYSGALVARLVLRERGRKLGNLDLPVPVELKTRRPAAIQQEAFQPIWAAVAASLRTALEGVCRGGSR